MPKKVYRSLFDSDDVYEVEELADNPEISTKGVAEVKADDAGEVTMKQLFDILTDIKGLLSDKKVGDANEEGAPSNAPAEEAKVSEAEPVIDEAGEEGEEEDDTKKDKKGVKDSYSGFSRVGEAKKVDAVASTQVAFQNRYAKIANS